MERRHDKIKLPSHPGTKQLLSLDRSSIETLCHWEWLSSVLLGFASPIGAWLELWFRGAPKNNKLRGFNGWALSGENTPIVSVNTWIMVQGNASLNWMNEEPIMALSQRKSLHSSVREDKLRYLTLMWECWDSYLPVKPVNGEDYSLSTYQNDVL